LHFYRRAIFLIIIAFQYWQSIVTW